MTQVLYPITLAIYAWITQNEPTLDLEPSFSKYSTSYVSLALFPVLIILSSKKDLSIFQKLSSFGVMFVLFLICFIIYIGIMSFTDTNFVIGSSMDAFNMTIQQWNESTRYIVLVNKNFSPLAGLLCVGYFLHTCSLSIVRTAKEPAKNPRNVFLGYFFVYLSYVLCGALGYFGFMGT